LQRAQYISSVPGNASIRARRSIEKNNVEMPGSRIESRSEITRMPFSSGVLLISTPMPGGASNDHLEEPVSGFEGKSRTLPRCTCGERVVTGTIVSPMSTGSSWSSVCLQVSSLSICHRVAIDDNTSPAKKTVEPICESSGIDLQRGGQEGIDSLRDSGTRRAGKFPVKSSFGFVSDAQDNRNGVKNARPRGAAQCRRIGMLVSRSSPRWLLCG